MHLVFSITLHRKICYGKGLRALRAMFPRPYCIHSEGALDKSIHLLQPGKRIEEDDTEAQLISETVRSLSSFLVISYSHLVN